ncbi:DNA repair protein complementing XP-A cells homolog [Tetranychus urticae]|uniref:XPA C-terminal domain-containing protein n=1 Tax=Tetranychus urticae TaxID=32264 RepID=T1K4Q6_TETUR|nr:DNA repair protein complementing XP-A cells homolog [Tetranychus urticae]
MSTSFKSLTIPNQGTSTTSNTSTTAAKPSTSVSTCTECKKKFIESFLKTNFDYNVCNACRDPKDKHSLITRTEAKNEYLLKDCDLDKREPPLRFIAKKNPNPLARGDMRLYLHIQVEERALEVWESEEALIAEKEKRSGKRKDRQKKDYDKKMKTLRMEVRSSLYKRKPSAHIHEYGEEKYIESEDMYEKTCKTCDHVVSYEKM